MSNTELHVSGSMISVTVARTDPNAQCVFSVKHTEPMMALDLLLAIQHDYDHSLAFRFSCRSAMCGTCAIQVNGRPVLACQTRILAEWSDVLIEPLARLPIIRDLVVDMTPFLQEWAQIRPYLISRADVKEIDHKMRERQRVDANLDCITCGVCYSQVFHEESSSEPAPLSPAVLNRIMVLMMDSRDSMYQERLAQISAQSLAHNYEQDESISVCPKGLDLAGALQQLRSWKGEERA